MLSVTLCCGKFCSKRQLAKVVCASQHRCTCLMEKRPWATATGKGSDPYSVPLFSATRALAPCHSDSPAAKGPQPALLAQSGLAWTFPAGLEMLLEGQTYLKRVTMGGSLTILHPSKHWIVSAVVTPEGSGLNSASFIGIWQIIQSMCPEPVLHLPAKSMGSRVVLASARYAATWSTKSAWLPCFRCQGRMNGRMHVQLRDGTCSKNISATKPNKPALAQTAQLRQGGWAGAIGSLNKKRVLLRKGPGVQKNYMWGKEERKADHLIGWQTGDEPWRSCTDWQVC